MRVREVIDGEGPLMSSTSPSKFLHRAIQQNVCLVYSQVKITRILKPEVRNPTPLPE